MSPATTHTTAKETALRVWTAVSFALASLLLTWIFWQRLWTGGGLVGSDIYAYYLPQKAQFANCVRQGTLPLWNHLVGQGYPQLAESQTGVFYPLHWVFYPWLPLNTAFSASILTHYLLAFLFTALLARRMGLSRVGSALAALVYTYGWFPPRICLEWSITGGAWLPLAVWAVESLFQTRYWRYAILLICVLALQLLAGHFVLAFVTQLLILSYSVLRLWFAPQGLPAESQAAKRSLFGWSGVAILVAFLVAAVQLLPTWELKHESQRRSVSAEHDPGFGYIPPAYLSQIVAPWLWYGDEKAFDRSLVPGGSRSNRVEAHLYFGIGPLLLAVWGIGFAVRRRERLYLAWLLLGGWALVYTTGCFLPITRHLPGFSFFEGPGRFGVVTTLAVALLAAVGYDRLYAAVPGGQRWFFTNIAPFARGIAGAGLMGCMRFVLIAGLFSWTTFDLFEVSRQVTYAFPVADPPTNYLEQSPLRGYLAEHAPHARLFSAAKNLPSLLGLATVPVYLGLGPAQYYEPELMLPQPWPFTTPPTAEHLEWFARNGVTHFLGLEPVHEEQWRAKLVWEGADPFLNLALGRPLNAREYLYDLAPGRGRVTVEGREKVDASVQIVDYQPNRVELQVESAADGRVVLTDLAYPGWQLDLDGKPVASETVDGMFRGAKFSAGNHALIWTYRPSSLYWGFGVSVSALFVVLALAHVRFRHPQLILRVLRAPKRTPHR
ncbi:MAG: YfhO family protein [Planctomycetes bacterium]|nr:YfhO family protein [Planctomycetota bacterium]